MKKNEIMANVTRTFHKVSFNVKKHSPEILVVAGVVGVVTSAVMACRATTKVNDILADAKETIEAVHKVSNDAERKEQYSEEDTKRALAIVYAKTGLEFVKLYGPSVVLGTASIGCIVYSNRILNKRNTALAAAYATIDKGFKEYRGRVIERFGKELDRELKYNIKSQEVEEIVVNEDGTETAVKKHIDVVNPDGYSEYSRFFSEGCIGWEKNAELNMFHLKQVQNWANEKLQSQGYLYLNDVYGMLGIPKTKAGHVVGWIYDPHNPDLDNFVDFGIYDVYTPNDKLNDARRDFVNGFERSILLDFNVMGNIYELMY